MIDRYLLGEPVSKPDVVAELLADRSELPAAAPFYRAFEAVGTRAADEAFVALRLVLAGREADDAAVRRLRALVRIARAAATGDRAGVASALRAEAAEREEFAAWSDAEVLYAAVRAAYRREVDPRVQ